MTASTMTSMARPTVQTKKTAAEIPLASLERTTLIQAEARSQERAFFIGWTEVLVFRDARSGAHQE
jgi:hypothetical protein